MEEEEEQLHLSEAAAPVDQKKAITIAEVMDAINLSPKMTINAGPMAIRFMHITQASHAPDAQMDTRSRQPRRTTWTVPNGAAMPFDVEGQRRLKINKLTVILIV
jgi:hypothetical protein